MRVWAVKKSAGIRIVSPVVWPPVTTIQDQNSDSDDPDTLAVGVTLFFRQGEAAEYETIEGTPAELRELAELLNLTADTAEREIPKFRPRQCHQCGHYKGLEICASCGRRYCPDCLALELHACVGGLREGREE